MANQQDQWATLQQEFSQANLDPSELQLLEVNKSVLLDRGFISARIIRQATVEQLTAAGVDPGAAVLLKSVFPLTAASARGGGEGSRAAAVGDTRAAAVGAPGGPLSTPLTVTLAKERGRHSVDFAGTPEWLELQQTVEDTFPEHQVEEYKLKIGKDLLTERNWKLFAEQSMDRSVTVVVISLAKPFSSFKEIEAYNHLALNLWSAHLDEDAFPAPDIDQQRKLDDHVIKATGLNTQGEVLEHVGRELALRCSYYTHPADHTKEWSNRELIGPVLFGVAALAGDVEIIAELNVLGKLGKGSVDFGIMYKNFCIVVAEAKYKLYDTLQEHFGQLAAEMRAAREQFIFKQLGKRKLDEGDEDFIKVPSFGVLTNGTAYMLYKHDPAARFDDERLLKCNTIPVNLKRGMDAKSAAAEAMNIIKRLLPIVQLQKAGMNEFRQRQEEKKRRLSHYLDVHAGGVTV